MPSTEKAPLSWLEKDPNWLSLSDSEIDLDRLPGNAVLGRIQSAPFAPTQTGNTEKQSNISNPVQLMISSLAPEVGGPTLMGKVLSICKLS